MYIPTRKSRGAQERTAGESWAFGDRDNGSGMGIRGEQLSLQIHDCAQDVIRSLDGLKIYFETTPA